MPAIFGTFQFDNDKPSTPIKTEQVYSSTAILPITKFLRENHGVGHENSY